MSEILNRFTVMSDPKKRERPVVIVTDESFVRSNSIGENKKTTFTNPDKNIMKDNGSLVWVSIKAIPIYKLTNNVRAPRAISNNAYGEAYENRNFLAVKLDAQEYTFKFLAPQQIMEDISHEWAPYDSLASNAAQLFASWGITAPEQINGILSTVGASTVTEFITKVVSKGFDALSGMFKGNWGDIPNKVYAGALNIASSLATSGYVPQYRVDTPLQYKGSNRRKLTLPFVLINTEFNKNNENVVLPVKLLQMFSSPSYANDADKNANVDIILPYLFEVKTDPGDLFYSDLCVLTGVQPTWNGPWINGYPSRCELRLDFMEYRPLEQGVFYGKDNVNNIIKVIQKERSNAYENVNNYIRERERTIERDALEN